MQFDAMAPVPVARRHVLVTFAMEAVTTFAIIAFLGAVAVAVMGADPLAAAAAALRQTLAGQYEVAGLIALSLPLMIVGFAAAASFKGGFYNLGLEGQLILGAAIGSIVGAHVGPFWSPLHIAMVLVAGGIAGGIVAWALSWLRVRFGVDEVVSTLLSNYIVILFAIYLATYPFRDPTRFNGAMHRIAPSARMSTLVEGTELTWGLAIVVAIAAVLYWLLHRSKLGEDWTLMGRSPSVARNCGIDARRFGMLIMTSSGFLAGLAGAFMVSATQHRYFANLGLGLGFDGILIAMIARYRILAVSFWALAYSWMLLAADGIEQEIGIPSEFAQVVIAIVILGVAVRAGLVSWIVAQVRHLSKPAAPLPATPPAPPPAEES
ncbi:ABC transporter permease [Phyllobacterium chamaecytisi]|uniref:ABC transporter permease n=1 Tax=Phyllobacterium chamaecytisi TaxID=2876082 RepID=UPI001CCCD1C9|nr:ABC transporter permease [Phyllobacterium sp. KW56]MBZ9603296.1 ABC transporter permease [Phyllobacterium sp. KW56]